MFMKSLLFLILLYTLAVSGDLQQGNEVTLSRHRSLGQKLNAIQSSDKPMETLNDPKIGEPTGIITLQDALALALMHNPELKAFSWEVRASEAGRLQASLLPNPELEVEVEEVGGTGERRGFDGAESTLQLSQLIELKGKRRKRTRVASLEKELAEWDYEAKRLDVLTETAKSFVGVLAAQERLKLDEELFRLSEQVLATVSQRVEAGKDSPVEKTKAEIALASVEIEWEKAGQNLESARKQLAATWAGKSAAFEKVAGKLDVVSAIPTASELAGLIAQNPDISRWAMEIEQRRAALELEKAKVAPDLTLNGGVRRFNETDDTALVVGVSIPLPVFNRNQGGILEAKHRLAKAGEERRAAEASIHTALAEAYQALSNAFTEATNLKNKVLDGAQSVFEASKTGYSQGKLNYLNVLDAQRTLFEAKVQYIEAITSYYTAQADVERLIGRSIDSETLWKK